MPQTLLTLLALLFASTLSLRLSETAVRSQTDMIRNEVDIQALGVATEVFEIIGLKDFDENTTGSLINDVPPGDMSPASSFGLNKALLAPTTDDIDDVHGMLPYIVQREVTHPETGDRTSLEYEVTATVHYVTDRDPSTGAPLAQVAFSEVPTYLKQVILTIRCRSLDGTALAAYEVHPSRIFAY